MIQIINNKAGMPFGPLAEEGVVELCADARDRASSSARSRRSSKTKYDYLIADAVLSAGEFELAARQARKKAIDIEAVLIDEFQVKIPAIGAALSKFFGVPYEPFKPDRIKPVGSAQEPEARVRREQPVVPIDESQGGPARCCASTRSASSASRIAVERVPEGAIIYKVTTQKDFKDTRQPVLRRRSGATLGDIGDLLGGPGRRGGRGDSRARPTTSRRRRTTSW